MTIPVLDQLPSVSQEVKTFVDNLKAEGFRGDIEWDHSGRLLGATDNSIYQVLPSAVLFPRRTQDIICLASCLGQHPNVFVAPRGGGTGTNGQSLSEGVLVDVSRYLNRIKEIHTQEKWAIVEPGVVLDQLNKKVKSEGLFFAPDLSPSNRATLGGMASTDACGKGSRVYGKTSDHILEMKLTLVGGEEIHSRWFSADELTKMVESPGKVGQIFSTVSKIATTQKSTVEKIFPKLKRFLAGYNLAKVFDDNGNFSLNYLLAGSEGTLAFITELKLKLTPKPKSKVLVLAKYQNFDAGLKAARELLEFEPTAIETVDDTIVGLARKDVIWTQVGKFFGSEADDRVSCVNLIEFSSDDAQAVEAQAQKLISLLEKQAGDSTNLTAIGWEKAKNETDIAALWALRKKGVGLLGNRPGERRPVAFVEDTVVPPEHLADYIREFRAILDRHGLQYGMFGHVDVGCLHVRPALNLRDEADEKLIRIITDEVVVLVKKYGGVVWGEHGKGLRSEYVPEFFGPLYESLQEIKEVFDPENQMNPGKIAVPKCCDDRSLTKLDEVPLRGHSDKKIPKPVKHAYEVAVNCNGNGACFNFEADDVMCPSFKVTRDRKHSPKGRATLIREWLRLLAEKNYDPSELSSKTGKLKRKGQVSDFNHEVYDAMSGCLSCKGCSHQCPVKVDIPDLKAKFLHHYHTRYRRPIKDNLIAKTEAVHLAARKFPSIFNLAQSLPGIAFLVEIVTGMIDPPLLASKQFERKWKKQGRFLEAAQLKTLPDKENKVLIVQDLVTSVYQPDTVDHIVTFLEGLGKEVYLVPLFENGKAKHVKGFLPEFQKAAAKAHHILSNYGDTGIEMIGIDPALLLTYREEYRSLFPNSTYQVMALQEWLTKAPQIELLKKTNVVKDGKVVWLNHCGEKASIPGSGEMWKRVFEAVNIPFEARAMGCCGMAGVYGHEKENLEKSKIAYALSWQPHVEKHLQDGDEIVATGYSCRSQVKRFHKLHVSHPLVALSRRMTLSS